MEKKLRKLEKIDLPIKPRTTQIKPALEQETQSINTSNQQNTTTDLNGENVYGGNVNNVQSEKLSNVYEIPSTNSVVDLGSIDTTIAQKTVDIELANINEIPEEKSKDILDNINNIPTNKITERLPNIYNKPNPQQKLGNLNVNEPVENTPKPTSIPNLDM